MGGTNNQFTLELPNGWEDRTVHVFMGPDDSGVQHMLNLSIDPYVEDASLEEYARFRIDTMMESLQSAEILKEEGRTLANGNEIFECVYKWIPAEGKSVFQQVVYMIDDGVAYIFSANFSKKTIKTIGVEVERIINSFSAGPLKLEED